MVISGIFGGLGLGTVGAAPSHRGPVGFTFDRNHPTVSGILVAKALNQTGNLPQPCQDRDVNAVRRAVSQIRGMVICTEEGQLVLVQLSSGTTFFSNNWVKIGLARFNDGDHIRAWGTLSDGGLLLSPTVASQDLNVMVHRGSAQITGTLIARPINGEQAISSACQERDQAAIAQAVTQNRGLVICTAAGKLVLVQITAQTRILARFGGAIGLDRLTDGDRINAWGALRDNGFLLNPTTKVQDVDVQEAGVDSQDFIAESGANLTLYVLKSDAGGPVQGIVHAVQGGDTHITLCNGSIGSWADLTRGKTIDISESLFNRRLMQYIHTAVVRVVSCP
jgi:hypothetical protein